MNIFPSFILLIHVTFSNYSLLLSVRFLHICNVCIYLAHAYILYFQISNCNVFVYVTLAFLRYSIVTFYCNDFCNMVSLKHTLKKKGHTFQTIGTEKYISLTVKSALLLYYLLYCFHCLQQSACISGGRGPRLSTSLTSHSHDLR